MSSLTTLNVDAVLPRDIRNDVMDWLEANKSIDMINSDEFDRLIPKELSKYERAHILNASGFEDGDDYYHFEELLNGDFRLLFRLTNKNKDQDLENLVRFLISFIRIKDSKAYIYYDSNFMGYEINLRKTLEEKEEGILNRYSVIRDGDEFLELLEEPIILK